MGTPSNTKLVVFDLGRVLVKICEDWDHASEVAELQGRIPVLDPISRAVLIELALLCEIGAITHEIFCKRVGHLFNVDADEIRRISEAYLIGPCDGAVQLLNDLKARGVKIACLSNTNAHHWSIMNQPGSGFAEIINLFDYRFASHELHMRKPDDEIFSLVEKVAELKPDQILFFDDSLDNIVSAETAGWEAVVINDWNEPVAEIRAYLTDSRLL